MNIYWFLTVPLLLSGLVHHLVIIKYNVWPWLAKPIDGGIVWRGKPLFGSNKTWRGFAAVIGLNSIFSAVMGTWWPLPGLDRAPVWIGFVAAMGYCLGELPTSFLKRRWNIGPSQQAGGVAGVTFYAMEQSDSILGAVLGANLVVPLTPIQNGILIILGTGLHILVDFGLYVFGYKKNLAKPGFIKKLLGQKDLPGRG